MFQIPMTIWRKRQAAILYHYASLDYLKPLLDQVNALVGIADSNLDQAKAEGRDKYLVDKRWGVRDTSANWSTYAYPFLAEFRQGVLQAIALRAAETYRVTDVGYCERGLREFSMAWSSVEEEKQFEEAFERIARYCRPLDQTVKRGWDDFSFAIQWAERAETFPRGVKFRVREDIIGESGKRPPRTGVYVPCDDPHGSLQFAWTGLTVYSDGHQVAEGALPDATTLNDLGLAALAWVGREGLWVDDERMFDFATKGPFAQVLHDDVFVRGKWRPTLASSAVARAAFVERPCKWYFVEPIEGEAEIDGDDSEDHQLRCGAGSKVPRSGWWYTPAIKGEQGFRFFEEGSRFPETQTTEWGQVIWQFDPQRQPK